jgi:choline dehydrogenase
VREYEGQGEAMRTIQPRADDAWDYVIVGGGTAGCVLAGRLSEDPATEVLLLEAGGEARGLAVRVPALVQKLPSDVNWLYPVEPDLSLGGREDPYSAGRILGGSSSTNHMMWARGNYRDYDEWEALGCTGWGRHGVLPYFRRAERFEDGRDPYRGATGPIHVGRTKVDHRMTDVFIAAAAEAGLPRRRDYNGEEQEGVALAQVNQRHGLRHSVVDAFLAPARKRRNLQVVTSVLVTRVLVEGGRAIGVEYRIGDRQRIAFARKEVLLSAGAVGSPKLLMLSGIGPPRVLERFGIPLVLDMPSVGQNMQEHPAASLVFEVTERTLNQDLTPVRLIRHALAFVFAGRGAITSTSGHAVAFLSAGPNSTVPDTQLIFVAFGLSDIEDPNRGGERLSARRLTARSGGRSAGRRQAAPDPLVTVTAVVLHPRGRGEVSLRSRDPTTPPQIRQELLGDAADLRALMDGCLIVRRIFDTRALRPYVVRERLPGAAVVSQEAWGGYLRGHAFRLFHATSTCAMGTGPEAVVDPRLRVRGIGSLRVIDASVMPTIPSGNTHAPTIMIAEKGSDMVLDDRP